MEWQWLRKSYRFLVYNSMIYYLYITLCVYHPKWKSSVTGYLAPFTLYWPLLLFPSGNHHTVVCVYEFLLLLSCIKRWDIATCNNMNGSWEYYAKQSKSDRKGQKQYDCIHMWAIKWKATNQQTRQTNKNVSVVLHGLWTRQILRPVSVLAQNTDEASWRGNSPPTSP